MPNRIEGEVFKVYSKDFRGKTNYTIKIDNDPIWYRCGQNRYAGVAEPGNRIAFDAEMNADGTSATVKSTPVLAKAAAPAATPTAGGGRDNSAGLQMRYQGALERAILFVKLAVETEALPLPKAAKARLGVLEAAIDRYTAQFYEDTNTLGAVVREAEGGGEQQAEKNEGEAEDGDE